MAFQRDGFAWPYSHQKDEISSSSSSSSSSSRPPVRRLHRDETPRPSCRGVEASRRASPGDRWGPAECRRLCLISSNARAFGTCRQVDGTRREGSFSRSPPRLEAAGDGMRFWERTYPFSVPPTPPLSPA